MLQCPYEVPSRSQKAVRIWTKPTDGLSSHGFSRNHCIRRSPENSVTPLMHWAQILIDQEDLTSIILMCALHVVYIYVKLQTNTMYKPFTFSYCRCGIWTYNDDHTTYSQVFKFHADGSIKVACTCRVKFASTLRLLNVSRGNHPSSWGFLIHILA